MKPIKWHNECIHVHVSYYVHVQLRFCGLPELPYLSVMVTIIESPRYTTDRYHGYYNRDTPLTGSVVHL